MGFTKRIVTDRFECDLCPNTGEVVTESMPNDYIPCGWAWSYRPDRFKATERHGNHVLICESCAKRLTDAFTPHPSKRR